MSAPVLLTAGRETGTGTLLAEAARRRGLDHALVTPDTGATFAGRRLHWYGGPLAADRFLAEAAPGCDLVLLEPHDAWLAELPQEFTGRRVELTTLAEAWGATRPQFVKPPSDKQFPAAVYADGSRLPTSGERIDPDTPVLVSDVVTFAWEYRLFVLDGELATASRYARFGRLDVAALDADPREAAVRAFAASLLAACGDSLPSATVVDVGLVQDPDSAVDRWAVVEANMPWFANSYAADPDAVLDVVLRATGPLASVSAHDRRFLRPGSGPDGSARRPVAG